MPEPSIADEYVAGEFASRLVKKRKWDK